MTTDLPFQSLPDPLTPKLLQVRIAALADMEAREEADRLAFIAAGTTERARCIRAWAWSLHDPKGAQSE